MILYHNRVSLYGDTSITGKKKKKRLNLEHTGRRSLTALHMYEHTSHKQEQLVSDLLAHAGNKHTHREETGDESDFLAKRRCATYVQNCILNVQQFHSRDESFSV